MSYVFDLDQLQRIAAQQAAAYQAAQPYPHAVIDDFLKVASANVLCECFPAAEENIGWDHFGAENYEVKMGCAREERFAPALRAAIHDMNSGPFIRFLEALTGIGHLIPDPHLVGGGVHLTREGGHLGIHADFNWHEGLQAHRRLNLLIYLTRDWTSALGGELELWDRQAKACQRIVEPLFNRAVIFSTRSDSFHGHPNRWKSASVSRKSIALYYYTVSRDEEEIRPPHSTLYKGYHVP